ncbi:hypothetical protein EV184_104280 [Sinorhizobium americanum]|uniref:Uncharacterized protein n=1 Tax=Sinorhizobium americanum TaxID=194963 RepID=A0A4R2BZQ5_9HYPH|nr:hypothetical protein EV184_104280 [Sinorhizobium americanum]
MRGAISAFLAHAACDRGQIKDSYGSDLKFIAVEYQFQ